MVDDASWSGLDVDAKIDALRGEISKLTDHLNSAVRSDLQGLKQKVESLQNELNSLKKSAVQRTPDGKVHL